MNLLKILFICSAIFAQGCRFSRMNDVSRTEALQYKNLIAAEFGLVHGEIALTLDDGPGPRSLALAEWLAAERVPVVYFMVGNNAVARPSVVKAISSMSFTDGSPAFTIANHTMTHEQSSLSTNYGAEVLKADQVLSPFIKSDFFFRPPFGNLLTETWLKQKSNESDGAFAARLAAARKSDRARVEKINGIADLDKYIGPVLWNVGTSMANGYAADWECWTLQGTDSQLIKRCIDGYIKNVNEVKNEGAVILAHDIHGLTIDMLMGTGAANGRSLIRELTKLGYRFVALNKNPSAYAQYRNRPLHLTSYLSAIPFESNAQQFLSVAADDATRIRVSLGDKRLFEGPMQHDAEVRVLMTNDLMRESGLLTIESYDEAKLVSAIALPLRKN